MEGKHDSFSGHKQKTKLCLMYLESKLQEDSCG